MPFVLDGSVALTWCFEDEANDYADGILRLLGDTDALVPAIWPIEVANVLLVGERRHRNTEARTAELLRFLESLSLAIDYECVKEAFASALDLGRLHGLTSYDACYLELALRRGLPLATLDEELTAAAKVAGVSIQQA